jgi:ketosteroid isomerase-like protein
VNEVTDRTRSLLQRLFSQYERGDLEPLFDHVADDVRWTVMVFASVERD